MPITETGAETKRNKLTLTKHVALILALALVVPGLLLAVTIPLTMPTMLLMQARIGASELSLWLLGLNLLAVMLCWFALRGNKSRATKIALVALICSLIGCVIAAIPIAQLPDTINRAESAMHAGLGEDYESHIPPNVATQMRSAPFSLGDYLTGLNLGSIQVARDIPYRTVAGHTLLLDRYDPPDDGPHPGLLVIHGGSWRGGDKGQYTQASYYFAAQGYVVYDIQYRLSAQGFRFPAQLEDVECALGHMRAHAAADNLDPERVVTFGRSAGAHLALLAAYRAGRVSLPSGCGRPSTIKATVAYYAPTDLRDNFINPAEPDLINTRQVLGDFLGGSPDQVPDRYSGATPQNWLDRPAPPTLLVHGASDQIVLSSNAHKLEDALRSANDTVVTITIPWAGHGFDAIFQGLSSQLALYYWERFMAYALANP